MAAFLQIVADLAVTYPETFETTLPLVFNKFEYYSEKVVFLPSASKDMEKTVTYLLDRLPCHSLSGKAVGSLLISLSQSGLLKASCRHPLANALKRLGQDEQLKIANIWKCIDTSQLKVVASKEVLQSFVGDAR